MAGPEEDGCEYQGCGGHPSYLVTVDPWLEALSCTFHLEKWFWNLSAGTDVTVRVL
jgi:hypothetical protein